MPSFITEKTYPVTPTYPIIPRTDLEIGKQLGFGAHGTVFEGYLKHVEGGSRKVALKKVFMLEKEVHHSLILKIMSSSKIALYAFSLSKREFAEGGSLFDRIHGCRRDDLEFRQILKWAIQVRIICDFG
ncbi:unnamed protein product [Gongylonema pulchrum]|uniref:Protein kinase domain-containing protein n=1 Tax=Gongylonema pulchrum TaxID=637853 RepID=A0A183D4F5_9BILA|nr:unnamed protein product [Gongylonema pulchrum]